MNKKIIALASAALVFCASSVFAANDNKNSDNKNCTGTEKCDAQKCDKNKKNSKDRKDRKGGKSRKDGNNKGARQAMNPFEGLNLTEQQAIAIKAIPNPREVMKEAVKNDTQKKTDIRTLARTVRADYLNSVKGVLTPQQYLQFLENSYMNNIQGGPQRPGQKGMKPSKDGRKADKPQGQRSQDQARR
ncbi:MAG: hypothetical protein NC043_02405 [Muribaculaceae bacterium]|nr:hypothetical protein [Muribaculaceae bacterium]